VRYSLLLNARHLPSFPRALLLLLPVFRIARGQYMYSSNLYKALWLTKIIVTFTAHYCANTKGTLCGMLNMKSRDNLTKMVNYTRTDEKTSRFLHGDTSIAILV
jgi:hypothetical protein